MTWWRPGGGWGAWRGARLWGARTRNSASAAACAASAPRPPQPAPLRLCHRTPAERPPHACCLLSLRRLCRPRPTRGGDRRVVLGTLCVELATHPLCVPVGVGRWDAGSGKVYIVMVTGDMCGVAAGWGLGSEAWGGAVGGTHPPQRLSCRLRRLCRPPAAARAVAPLSPPARRRRLPPEAAPPLPPTARVVLGTPRAELAAHPLCVPVGGAGEVVRSKYIVR